MNTSIKAKIDSMNYIEMLRLWRFAPSGHIYFKGETGDYFKERMMKLKSQLEEGEHTNISKRIGWM